MLLDLLLLEPIRYGYHYSYLCYISRYGYHYVYMYIYFLVFHHLISVSAQAL